tara:strand:- start:374 stop:1039 length:666 start_codon:yes stop_codon:yes gene_type:complete
MPNLQSYFIAGPENLYPHHISKNEKLEKALVRIVSELAKNGLDVFQLRAKSMNDNEIIDLIKDLKSATSNTKMKLCINDNVNVASKCKGLIDILHLGQSDMKPNEAKKMIDQNIEIGLSITNKNQLDDVPNCVNYLGVGPIFPTGSKKDASEPIGSNILREIINKTEIPVVAIGGISLDNIYDLFKLGVSGVAVISAILNEYNPIENFHKLKENIIKGSEK